ncbi:MAG: 1-acyl-sn-glycerol-3-phosphate acyltransferase, partial [Caldilinea sp.]
MDNYARASARTCTYVIDLVARITHLLYTRAYGDTLHYDRSKLEEIYALAQRYPVIFLPTHRSNLDHLVLTYMLYENGHPPNHPAGGINMNFFPVGPLVRRVEQ